MTLALLTFLPAAILGWALVRLLLPLASGQAPWRRWLLEVSLGCGIGAGLASCLFFVLTWSGFASRTTILALELAAVAAAAVLLRLFPRRVASARPDAGFRWTWALRIAVLMALAFFLLDVGEARLANPHGDWDAFAIWNVRAKFLAGGAQALRNAVSPDWAKGLFGVSHPAYPLLTPGFVARAWTLIGQTTPEVPQAAAIFFALATLGVMAGALARERSESLGLLAVLVLFATEFLVSQVALQYADIPLSFFLLGAVALAASAAANGWEPGTLVLAGLCAGLGVWTKNEGLACLPFLAAVVLWRGRVRAAAWLLAGAAPAVLLTIAFKVFFASGTEPMFPKTAADLFAKLGDPGRWWQILYSFGRRFWELGFPSTHPLLLAGLLALALGFRARRDSLAWLWLLVPPLGLLGADFGAYLVTTAPLTWHLDTSNNRLVMQVLPALLFGFFFLLRVPVSPAAPVEKPRSKKARR